MWVHLSSLLSVALSSAFDLCSLYEYDSYPAGTRSICTGAEVDRMLMGVCERAAIIEVLEVDSGILNKEPVCNQRGKSDVVCPSAPSLIKTVYLYKFGLH